MSEKLIRVRVTKASSDGGWYDDKIGKVYEVCETINEPGFGVIHYIDPEECQNGRRFIEDTDCEPIADAPADEPSITTDDASPQVVDLLANLARRVTDLERNKRNDDWLAQLSSIQRAILADTHTPMADRLLLVARAEELEQERVERIVRAGGSDE